MDAPVWLMSDLRSIPLPQLVALDAAVSLADAAAAMIDAGVTAALLRSEPCAIVTERDVVRAAGTRRSLLAPALEVATRDPLVVPDTASLAEAAETMVHHRVGHLLVIDVELRPLSIVSARDLAELLVEIVRQPAWIAALRRSLHAE
jgi:CBS domain-containing protein